MAKTTSTKAIAGGVAGTLVAFLTGLTTALQTPGVTDQEWVAVALATVLGGAAAFGLTWTAPANRQIP
jgi:predicted regulator of Ras-like GTPase activity (Roadblock/LC7/MglB family)